jgi:ubiquinone/menaquinone biosynthesis C-methylase UbiE
MIIKNELSKYKMQTPDAYRRVLDDEVNIDAPNIVAYVGSEMKPSSRILEMGIMPGSGSLQFVDQASEYTGTHPNIKVIPEIEKTKRPSNLKLYVCPLNQQPIDNQSVDVVLSLLGPIGHSTSEAYRVLEPGGKFYVWKVGEGDKKELKAMFGNDLRGPRGYNLEMAQGERVRLLEQELETNGFEVTEKHEFFFDSYLPDKATLIHFLKTLGARAVRDFDEHTDNQVLDEIVAQHTRDYQFNDRTESGIWIRKHEVLVVGTKK